MKTDVRVMKTRSKLQNALLQILESTPQDEITVLRLCAAADVSRATFYKHYVNCQDVLQQLEEDILTHFTEMVTEQPNISIADTMRLIRMELARYPEYNRIMIHQKRNLYLVHKMIAVAKNQSLKRLKVRFPKLSKKELDMLYILLSYGIFSVGLYCDDRYGYDQVDLFIDKIVGITVDALDKDKPVR